jgi:hypothetical protein
LLLLTGQFEVQVTGVPGKTRDAKTRKTGHYANEKCFGGSIFLKTERVAATRRFFCERAALRNGFVSDVCCYAAK